MRRSEKEIKPRNGHTLVVGGIARISGCGKQKGVSLEDQTDHIREEGDYLYEGPIEYIFITSTGKGEQLDRPELEEIEALLRSGSGC